MPGSGARRSWPRSARASLFLGVLLQSFACDTYLPSLRCTPAAVISDSKKIFSATPHDDVLPPWYHGDPYNLTHDLLLFPTSLAIIPSTIAGIPWCSFDLKHAQVPCLPLRALLLPFCTQTV